MNRVMDRIRYRGAGKCVFFIIAFFLVPLLPASSAAAPPVSNFSANPTSGDRPLVVNFTDLSIGPITSWFWTFGDGQTDTLQNTSHTYSDTGFFDVTLSVTGPAGTDDTTMVNLIHVTEPLVANFSGLPRSGNPPLAVQFADQSTGEPGEPVSWSWRFGDNSPDSASTLENPQHTYTGVGTYTVSLTVAGYGGRSDDTTMVDYIVVTEPPPVAQFSGFPTSGRAPLTVTFTDYSSGTITSWEWDFGDGNMSFEKNPVHEYTRADSFDVSLTVSGPGGSDTELKPYYITVDPGAADTILVYGINDPLRAGDPSNVTVEIQDLYGNRVTDYSGTVHFSSNDPGNESLPPDYTFNPAGDQGIHSFTNGVTLVTVGERYVEVDETGNPSLTGRQSGITVQPNDPASLVLTPGDTVNVTVGASRVFTAEVTDNYTNTVSGQRIDLFLKGTADGFLSENSSDPNPTFGSGTQRYGFSDSSGHVTVLYTAPSEADLFDVLDAMAQPYIDSTQVNDVVIRSTASGATKLVILPEGPIVTTANTPFDISVEAQDDFGNLDASDTSTVLLGSSSPSMEFSTDGFQNTITQITLSGGTTTNLQARDQTTGNPSITATDQAGILAQGTKTNITINPGPADHLSLTGIPGSITAGDPQTVSVEVFDLYNNRVTDYNGTVSFSTDDPGGQVSLPPDYTYQPTDAGFHTFNNGVTLVTVGIWYVMVRDTVNSSVFDIVSGIQVVPASADSLDISGIPETVEAGSANPFTVTAFDPYDNIVTDYLGTVHFKTDDPGSEVALPGDYSFQSQDQGVHQFTPGMTLVTVGTWMLEADEVGSPSVHGSHSGINVTHSSVDSLILSGLPGSAVAGSSHSLSVEAVDRYMNTVLNYSGTVQFSSSDPAATVPAPYTFLTEDQGYHNFVDGVVFRTAGLQTVEAIDFIADVTGRTQGTNVNPGQPFSLVITPPDTVPVTVDAGVVFTATVRDSFSNAIEAEEVTIFFNDAADGYLSDNPGDPNDTQGTTLWQQGMTDTEGKITVLYNSPSQADIYDVLDASSTQISAGNVEDVTIVTVSGGATKLVILPNSPIQSTAGDPFTLIIEAWDSNDNRDSDDSTLVLLTSDSDSMKFSIDDFQSTVDTIQLVNGRSQNLKAMDTIAGNPSITAQDADSLGFRLSAATKSDITIVPSVPDGTIRLGFSGRDTLTANGSSSTSIVSQSIVDTFENNVGAGVEVTVSAEIGTITSTDVDGGIAGVQVETDTLGTITFDYRSGTVAGEDTLRAVSVEGDASGVIVAILQSPATLTYTQETLSPNTVSPGTVQEFELVLVNGGGAGVTLHDSTSFNFGDGQTQFLSLLSGVYFIGGDGGVDTIRFLPDTIPNQMPEGAYTPTLDVYGTDSNEAPFHQVVLVSDENRLHVSSLILNSVAVFADTVSLGDSVGVRLEVKNAGATSTNLNEAGLIFSPPGGQFNWELMGLPITIPGNGTRDVDGYIRVGSLTPTGPYTIDAFVSGTSQGGAVSDSSANIKDSWVVVSAALASYVSGSIQPMIISGGGSYAFQVGLINLGTSDINLNEGQTHFSIGEGGELLDVYIPKEEVMPGDSSLTTLTFNSGTIPEPVTPGYYPAALYLSGNTEHGGTFLQVIDLPDSILVEAPPAITYFGGSISNQVISSGYEYAFSLRVENRGGADLVLDSSETVFTIEGNDTSFNSNLDSQGASTIAPGTDTTLTFLSAMVPGSLASGEHPSFAVLRGNYNSVGFTDTLHADSVMVETPATLRVSKISSPEKASQGETFSVAARVANLGEAYISTNGTLLLSADSLTVGSPELTFGPSLPDTVTWQVSVPSGLNPGDYLLSMSIDQVPLDENSGQPAKMDNPQGVTFPLSVVEKNQLSLERIDIGGIPPQNVFKGQRGVPMFPILSRSLGDREGEIQLNEIEVRVEERGGIPINSPENVLDRIYLKSSVSGEEILAEATDPSQGKYSISITDGYRVSSEPDTLLLFVDVSDGAGVITFQLMIDGESAIEAVVLATQTPASIVEGYSDIPIDVLRRSFTGLNQRDFASSLKIYPTPMGSGDGSTTFSYYLPEDAEVTIAIYTLTGAMVRKLVFAAGENGGRGPDVNQVTWDGSNGVGRYVINGVYICFASARTRSGGIYTTKYKLAVMR